MKDWLDTKNFWKLAEEGVRFKVVYHGHYGLPFDTDEVVTYIGHSDCYCHVRDCKGNGLFLRDNGKKVRMCMSWNDYRYVGANRMRNTYLILHDGFFEKDEFLL